MGLGARSGSSVLGLLSSLLLRRVEQIAVVRATLRRCNAIGDRARSRSQNGVEAEITEQGLGFRAVWG